MNCGVGDITTKSRGSEKIQFYVLWTHPQGYNFCFTHIIFSHLKTCLVSEIVTHTEQWLQNLSYQLSSFQSNCPVMFPDDLSFFFIYINSWASAEELHRWTLEVLEPLKKKLLNPRNAICLSNDHKTYIFGRILCLKHITTNIHFPADYVMFGWKLFYQITASICSNFHLELGPRSTLRDHMTLSVTLQSYEIIFKIFPIKDGSW